MQQMSFRPFRVSCLIAALLLAARADAQDQAKTSPPETRAVWTTSRIVGSPDPPPPYQQTRRYPNLKFDQPLYIERDPCLQRLWVIERGARVYSFPDQQDVMNADLFVDLKDAFPKLTPHEEASGVSTAYGLAFHPQFPDVPFCWLTYTLQAAERRAHLDDGTRLSRFRVEFDDNGVPRCDVGSERVLLSWLEGGHNGACLRFGPDGYLYVSTGDGEVPNPPDPRRAGQDVTNLLSSVLRIDVNPNDDGPLYRIPEDNPFVQPPTGANPGTTPDSAADGIVDAFTAAEALPEIFAYGFRNPWKMNFGPDGQLWVGDVGWEMYEMVYNVKSGGNYGWSITEGPQPVIPSGKRGPTPIRPAAVAYTHTEGASVTGGFVYQGSRLPELRGKYVFGDYETRRIWSAKITPSANSADFGCDILTELTDLVAPSVRIVAFGEDTAGELLLLHFDEGTIYGLDPNESAGQPSDFPQRLSQTGLFADPATQQPSAGVLPFDVNVPMWNDGAAAERFVAVPSADPINVLPGAVRRQNSILRESMQFPTNSVLTRTVSLNDDSGRTVRLETQVLHFNGNVWNPYTYVWSPDQTDAELAPRDGQILQLAKYGTFADRDTWPVHSRSECLRCHNSWVGGPLAFSLPQLNRSAGQHRAGDDRTGNAEDDPSESTPNKNQLAWFQQTGLLTGAVPADLTKADTAAAPLKSLDDVTASIDDRARSWLSVNCAHCHQNGAGGTATIDLRREASSEDMKVVGATPVQGTFLIPNAAIVAAGHPAQSVLLYRISCTGRGRMPHIGSHRVDTSAVNVLRQWIASLEDATTPAETPNTEQRSQTPDTTSAALELVADLDAGRISATDKQQLLQSVRHAVPEIRNLFTRFQPVEYRRTLNQTVDAAQILQLPGDVQRGAAIFADKRYECVNCHKISGQGGQIGPDLTDVGKRLKRPEILQSILEPSAKIDPRFAAWTVVTNAGRVHTGLLIDRTEQHIHLRTTRNEDIRLPHAEIDEFVQQTTSLMPDRLLTEMSASQIADLLALLVDAHQLKKP